MKTEAQQKAKRKYLAKGKRLTVDFYPSEADLIEHIEKQPRKQTYIKELIRKDMVAPGCLEATEKYMTDRCSICGFEIDWNELDYCDITLSEIKHCPGCGAKIK